MSKIPTQPIATIIDQLPTSSQTSLSPDQPLSLPVPIPPEPSLIDLFCNWIEDPAAILIREWGVDGTVSGEWSIAEFLRDVLDVSRQIVLELSVEERIRLRCAEGEDVFVAVVSGGCYAFAVLMLAVYTVGGVVVPLCRYFLVYFVIVDGILKWNEKGRLRLIFSLLYSSTSSPPRRSKILPRNMQCFPHLCSPRNQIPRPECIPKPQHPHVHLHPPNPKDKQPQP
jgi:hypothetical protein